MSSSFALRPHPTVRRYSNLPGALRPSVVRPSAMAGAVILCVAILIAALSTVDPLWWHLHFSRLGMFADASGYTFNGGVVTSGLVIAAGSVPLAIQLATAQASGRIADARAARMLPPLLLTLGLCLALIGVIPLTMNEFLHDRAANGVLLSFLGLVIVSRRTVRELPAFLGRYALVAVVVLVVGIGFMVSGIINLAAFEVLAFGSVLSWVHLLERSVRALAVVADPTPAPPIAVVAAPVADESAPRRSTDVARRGSRLRVPRVARAGVIRTLRVAHLEHEFLVPPERRQRLRRATAPSSPTASSRPRATGPAPVTRRRRSTSSTSRAPQAPSPASRG